MTFTVGVAILNAFFQSRVERNVCEFVDDMKSHKTRNLMNNENIFCMFTYAHCL